MNVKPQTTSVIYYSASREHSDFESKIVDNLKKSVNGRHEIISVTQKPIDLGKNIVVGVHDQCYHNEFRQIQIGLKEATSDYVFVAESDCLYPPSYFDLTPEGEGKAYRYDNVWVHYTQFRGSPKFWYKSVSDCAQLVDRRRWLSVIDPVIDMTEEWTTRENGEVPYIQIKADYVNLWTGDPIITFKTRQGIKSSTTTKRGFLPRYNLPYWGDAIDLRAKYITL
jgi:hypothetical protein